LLPHKGFLAALVTPVQALILHFLHNLGGCGRLIFSFDHHHDLPHLDALQVFSWWCLSHPSQLVGGFNPSEKY